MNDLTVPTFVLNFPRRIFVQDKTTKKLLLLLDRWLESFIVDLIWMLESRVAIPIRLEGIIKRSGSGY